MKRYQLKPAGSLFITRATVFGPEGMRVVRLLVDTGSVHTILAVEVLESIGCSPAASTDHIRIVTGNGFLIAARVKVDGFQCLGRKILDMPIVAHTLPMGSWINGLLGMDFLRSHGFRLLLDEGVIEAPR